MGLDFGETDEINIAVEQSSPSASPLVNYNLVFHYKLADLVAPRPPTPPRPKTFRLIIGLSSTTPPSTHQPAEKK